MSPATIFFGIGAAYAAALSGFMIEQQDWLWAGISSFTMVCCALIVGYETSKS